MRLAVGDVVRDRRDLVMGTVIGLDSGNSRLVVVQVPGQTVRVLPGRDLEIVRRYTRPRSTKHRVVALAVVVGALTAAYVAAHSVQLLGGSWLLMVAAALGTYTGLDTVYSLGVRLAGSRRTRV
ncbi:hypothetical protein N4G70_27645 [Streptomyces sp. ASQP_92]|uniref:hypothetical protein n=1 Tax=Streptomyces sp. ASQP_92 TaxID=2979116 RepID=UPI0021C0C4DF|nr:hypothetical protein [Streptomyces sp. ASQP_92]MCT9092614.1 hypothetical protein [Streptomyces sp. ASQP_92]